MHEVLCPFVAVGLANALKEVSDGHLCWMPLFLTCIFCCEAEKGGFTPDFPRLCTTFHDFVFGLLIALYAHCTAFLIPTRFCGIWRCAMRCPSSKEILRVLMNKRPLRSSDLLSSGEIFFVNLCFFFGFRCRYSGVVTGNMRCASHTSPSSRAWSFSV